MVCHKCNMAPTLCVYSSCVHAAVQEWLSQHNQPTSASLPLPFLLFYNTIPWLCRQAGKQEAAATIAS